ncbi:DeoR/GlpR family DNA-binding transcription regulator [Microbacterium caowuchunii]|uniref:DeoR/GlpR transcriptional regulator n=1 Tax=Microbacterium caowuchunii TaxID=2614638 RepID=A0A5N0TBA9_9MICO|nr:DeoR/GlpR family DNA-binding transcription regulator [Microbacterium caowuchunii]KAA9132282.1 DeoR/GlpR transcriptional regulator [Microbacterium caowuchunii]
MEIDSVVRVDGILAALEHQGQVSVSELAQRFGVSAVTIRKDLHALERRSLLQRVRGGARAAAPAEEGSFADRLSRGVAAKKAVARYAAALVRNGDVIALDSSTSAYFLALELLGHRDLVVVTNSLRSATVLVEESNATVVLMGGTIRRTSASTVGDVSEVLSGRGRVAHAFLGLAALSIERGLLELSVAEAESKRVIVDAAREVVGLFDSGKADGFGLHSFAATDRVTRLITDTGFSDEDTARWQEAGVQVDRCPVHPGGRHADEVGAPMAEVG